MADQINMQQSEYDALQQNLTAVHESLLQEEEQIRDEIIKLTQVEGGFYVTMISAKIDALLSNMKSGPMSHLRECFVNTEEAVAAYIAAVTEIDVIDQ